jgi:hypothetical protein
MPFQFYSHEKDSKRSSSQTYNTINIRQMNNKPTAVKWVQTWKNQSKSRPLYESAKSYFPLLYREKEKYENLIKSSNRWTNGLQIAQYNFTLDGLQSTYNKLNFDNWHTWCVVIFPGHCKHINSTNTML